ncbi:hypothetical protein [Acidovorax sp. NCPPB 4044]|uniref:hypothetical protein n=1 Tax=Acidovorax sp. NCPPB 4044 TaxID=2940490 RepID=UPI0023040B36|nr:hypothetical protein [Acidovorax sp. NCPPB 4044]MDA8519855.1 hypothetical protein [Acidovorax sp. NCPPB 4044]
MHASAPPPAPDRRARPAPWGRRLAWGAAAAAVLAAAFALYGEPGFVVMMADQVWSCF